MAMFNIYCRPFWTEAGANALVVEADAFKETDVIYRAISSMGHHNDMLQTAELVRSLSIYIHKKMYTIIIITINDSLLYKSERHWIQFAPTLQLASHTSVFLSLNML
jgi:hypothetical protein